MSPRVVLGRRPSPKRQTERVLVYAVLEAARRFVHEEPSAVIEREPGDTLEAVEATVRAYESWERRRPNRARRGPGAAA